MWCRHREEQEGTTQSGHQVSQIMTPFCELPRKPVVQTFHGAERTKRSSAYDSVSAVTMCYRRIEEQARTIVAVAAMWCKMPKRYVM